MLQLVYLGLDAPGIYTLNFMDKLVLNLLKLQILFKIAHWQTKSYAQHKAFDKVYSSLDSLLDELVETHQGKYGRIMFNAPLNIELVNFVDVKMEEVLREATEYIVSTFSETHDSVQDSDCLNIRDEILSELNKLKYLLTLS